MFDPEKTSSGRNIEIAIADPFLKMLVVSQALTKNKHMDQERRMPTHLKSMTWNNLRTFNHRDSHGTSIFKRGINNAPPYYLLD